MGSIPRVDGLANIPPLSEKTPKPKNGKTTDVALSKIPSKQEPCVKITVTIVPGGSPITLPSTKLLFKEMPSHPVEGEEEAEKVDKSESASPDMEEGSAEEEIDYEDDILDVSESSTSSDDSKDGKKQSEKEAIDDDEEPKKSGKKLRRR